MTAGYSTHPVYAFGLAIKSDFLNIGAAGHVDRISFLAQKRVNIVATNGNPQLYVVSNRVGRASRRNFGSSIVSPRASISAAPFLLIFRLDL